MKNIILFLFFVNAAFAQSTWDGTARDTEWYNEEETSFTITTAAQFAGFARLVNLGNNFASKIVKLGADIDLGSKNWSPIGSTSTSFKGIFDGSGYTVRGMYVNYGNENHHQGLFKRLDGYIKNVGVIGSVGGENEANSIGGLVGTNQGTVSNSYFIGNVKGRSDIGGLVGTNQGRVINSYFAGSATGTGALIGGAIGNRGQGTMFNNYYDEDLNGWKGNYGNKTTEEMQSAEFVDSLNFVASNKFGMHTWVYSEGKYPALSSQNVTTVTIFESGAGTEANPYLIKTKKQLEDFSSLVNRGMRFTEEYIELGANIDLEATEWTPIGTEIAFFSGFFDGKGYTVGNFYTNNEKENQGLFGYFFSGELKNVGVINADIKGRSAVGGLIGFLGGGAISNCYSLANVNGSSAVGGLVGRRLVGSITDCYSAGEVTGGTSSSFGGLIGYDYNGTIINSYYDRQISGKTGAPGTATVTAEMKQMSTFNTFKDWDFTNVWGRRWDVNNGYPYLRNAENKNIPNDENWYQSDETEFTINRLDELLLFAHLVSNKTYTFYEKTVKLNTNIILNDITDLENWATTPPARTWLPIGITGGGTFNGTFDGNGYIISGVYINGTDSYKGLFGRINPSAKIKNIGVTSSYIKGASTVGGLVGQNYGGNISNSYSLATVSGSSATGGLVGHNYGIITNSYSAGAVTGAGGLVGLNSTFEDNKGTVISSYYDMQTSGQSSDNTDKGVGKSTEEMKLESTFVGWDFTDIWRINFAINEGYPHISCDLNCSSFSGGGSSSSGGGSSSSGSSSSGGSSSDETSSSSSSSSSSDEISSSSSSSSDDGTSSSSSSSNETSSSSSSDSGTPEPSSSSSQRWPFRSSSSDDGASPVTISRIASGQTIIQATSNAILLENLPNNAKVKVYDLRGKIVYSQVPTLNSQFIPIQTKGLYIIKINSAVSRVVVR
jgi:hypothetical protein